MTDAHKVKPLADALLAWVGGAPGVCIWPDHCGSVLDDAIRQATKAETIEWLAAIAERYGFKPPEETDVS